MSDLKETVSKEQVESRIAEVFNNPSVSAKVVDLLVRTKPATYSNRSIAPYYNKEMAEQIKPTIDALIADKQPRMFSYSSYGSLKPRTLYSKINQSMHYLCDMLDTPGDHYKTACQHIQVKQGMKGIVLSWRVDEPLVAIPVTTILEVSDWEKKMEKWVEESEIGSIYHKQNLALSEDKVREIRSSFAGLTNIIWKVTAFEIKLIKINPI